MRQPLLLVVLIGILPFTAHAAVPVAQGPSDWIEPSSAAEQAALAATPAYQRFLQSAPGQWRATFDPVLATPRAIYGSGLPLLSLNASQRSVESAAMRFLDDNSGLFGARRGDFAIDAAMQSGDLWVVSASQRHAGLPIQGGRLSLVIKQGRLILVQGVTYRVDAVDGFAKVTKDDAVARANRGLGLGPRRFGKQKDSDQTRQIILPMRTPGAVVYRMAWEVRSRREDEQGVVRQHLVSYIDAVTGDMLAAYDGNRHAYSLNATVAVERRTVGDPLISFPTPFLNIAFAGMAAQTDSTGSFSFTGPLVGPQPVAAQLRSRYATVFNAGGPNASFNGVVNDNVPFSLVWNAANADPSERMSFRAVVESNRFAASVFPSLAWLDTAVPAAVNINDQCNAFFDGTGINMFRGGTVCNATGRIFDVVAHEWGHALDFNAPGSFVDAALSEFIGDLVAFSQTDDSRFAPGFFVSSSAPLRDMQSPSVECFDSSRTEVHDAGELLGSVVWDIREDLKAAGVSSGDVRKLMLLPIAIGQTRSEWYLAMLAADDDDGDLANGTPHECLIYRQFELHSCAGERWPGLPPASSITASPSVLWPANHQMVPVNIEVVAANACSASTCRVISVESSEPVAGVAWVVDGSRVMLRAERSGKSDGRVYTIHLECTDRAGNASSSAVTVTVPHDQR
jgi:hypothetical protein